MKNDKQLFRKWLRNATKILTSGLIDPQNLARQLIINLDIVIKMQGIVLIQ